VLDEDAAVVLGQRVEDLVHRELVEALADVVGAVAEDAREGVVERGGLLAVAAPVRAAVVVAVVVDEAPADRAHDVGLLVAPGGVVRAGRFPQGEEAVAAGVVAFGVVQPPGPRTDQAVSEGPVACDERLDLRRRRGHPGRA